MSRAARRTARADAAHAAATSPAAWLCHRPGCPIAGQRQPAASELEAVDASARHQGGHDDTPPSDLEARRAAWVAAGRPPFPWPPPPPPLPSPPARPRSAWDDREEETWLDRM